MNSLYTGATRPGMKTGLVLTPYFSIPPLIRSTPKSMKPPISIAPQKVISPSPWLKCRSPTESFAPRTCTGTRTREPWVGNAGVADAGQMPRGGVLPVEVPDRLVGVREVVGQEPAGVGLGEDAGVPPTLAGGGPDLLGHRAEVEDVHHQEVAGLGALDLDGAAEHMGNREVHVPNVIG